jgi:cation diffusion facilitator family transporter
MQWVRDYVPDEGSRRLYTRALVITLVGNVLLAASKGAVAYVSGSVAIYADAANSISDVLYSVLMAMGLWVAQRPPDISHPQGHRRFEPLVGLAVAASMTFAGYEASRATLERFLGGGMAVAPGLPSLVLLGSAAIKAVMYVAILRIARAVDSPTLGVAAKDNLSDVLTSVAAFAGVVGSSYVNRLLDPVAGFLVSAWIFRAAWGAWHENIAYLTGGGASPELLEQITQAAAQVPGVLDVHQVIAEYVGPQLVADVHVNVDGRTPLAHSHAIADVVSQRIEALPEVDRAYVHLEPPEQAMTDFS